MSNLDITRYLFRPAQHYSGVRMQERRALLDSDWNEGARIRAEIFRQKALDLFGPRGSPDCGFKVAPSSVVILPGDQYTFTLQAGSLWVGGSRVVLDADTDLRYQPDWLQFVDSTDLPSVPPVTRNDLLYAFAWNAPVTPAEDLEFQEPFLGPWVETSGRTRQFVQVHVAEGVPDGDCDTVWADFLATRDVLPNCAGTFVNEEGEFKSPVRLKVSFVTAVQENPTQDPCAPCVDGDGYLGDQNQAIRVQVTGDGSTFTWGFDNAAPVYRVRLDGTTVTILNPPDDEEFLPLKDQVVEILPWGALLDNGQKTAATPGFFTSVAGSFVPATGTMEITAAPPPGTFVESWPGHPRESELPGPDGLYYFARVWRRGEVGSVPVVVPVPEIPIPVTPGETVTLGETGVQVEFDQSLGGPCPGDFWVVTLRRNAPTAIVPWDLASDDGAAPHGPRRFFAPVGALTWVVDQPVPGTKFVQFDDCRRTIHSLSGERGCCTYTVSGDAEACDGDFLTIQAAIDALPEEGGRICVLPGEYPEEIHITNRADIVIRGCGARTRIVNKGGSGVVGSLAQPAIITVCDSQRLTFEDFTVEADGVPGIRLKTTDDADAPTSDIELSEIVVQCRAAVQETNESVISETRSALEVFSATDVLARDCSFRQFGAISFYPVVFLQGSNLELTRSSVTSTGVGADDISWGGVQIAGGSDGVLIESCTIQGGLGHGVSLGNVNYAQVSSDGSPDLSTQFAVPIGSAFVEQADGDNTVSLTALNREGFGGATVLPVPGAALQNIVLRGNTIRGMGTSGISVAGFWSAPFADASLLSVIVSGAVVVADNVIEDNLSNRPIVGDVLAPRLPGAGGVCLGRISEARIAGNRIQRNGPDYVVPSCGVYVYEAIDVVISDNTVLDNGVRDTDAPGIDGPGRRGGIVVMQAAAPQFASFLDGQINFPTLLPGPPAPALVVTRNVVDQPAGRALYVPASWGDVSVVGNQLRSQGNLSPVTGDSAQVLALAVDLSAIGQESVNVSGTGEVVHVRGGLPSLDLDVEPFLTDSGTRIQFNHNQVGLLWLSEPAGGVRLAAVTIDALTDDGATGGDVSLVGNQLQANMGQPTDPVVDPGRDLLASHLVVAGRSVRCLHNRVVEGRTDALLSGFTWGVEFSNWTKYNETTHCIVSEVVGASAQLDGTENLELIDQSAAAEPICPQLVITPTSGAPRSWSIVLVLGD